MHDSEAEEYWNGLKSRLEVLRKLDVDYNLVFGAHVHEYVMEPPIPERTIVEHENRLDIALHPNYRHFLQYFGSGGAGPGCGIYSFPDKTWQPRLSIPLELEPFSIKNLPTSWEDETESLESLDGVIRIGTFGSPTSYYFIQTGDYAGNVLLAAENIVTFYGPFYEWYSSWIENTIKEIKNLPILDKIKVGMSCDELIEVVSLPHKFLDAEINDCPRYIEFEHLTVHLTLDEQNQLKYVQRYLCGESRSNQNSYTK